ncbi:sporulation membrane protein YtrI [Pueribacillus sp. YX66]|uniref:sporulation membrane protein YtrI n=1 Tax=Pueribacillus sp. YX66 TaxID=3229242 RepID=UPI00358CEB80
MRIPFFYRIKTLQHFFAGLAFGTIIGWFLFLLFFGIMHERQIDTITEQRAEIKELNEKIELFQKDIEEINEQSEKQLLIKEIKLEFLNHEKLKLNEMEIFELEKMAQHYLNQLLLNKHVDTVSKNKELLISTLENKQFTFEKKQYSFKVRQLYLYTTVEFFVDIQLSS